MKRSNLLLSTLILSSLILVVWLTLLVSHLFERYRFNYSAHNSGYVFLEMKPAKVIRLNALREVKIFSSDSLRVEVINGSRNKFLIRNSGDTLYVRSLFPEIASSKDSVQIRLYVPSETAMVMDSSSVELKGDFDVKYPSSFSLQLFNTDLRIPAEDHREFFDKLSIEDRGLSSVIIGERAYIMNVSLKNVSNARFANAYHISNLVTTVDPIASGQ